MFDLATWKISNDAMINMSKLGKFDYNFQLNYELY